MGVHVTPLQQNAQSCFSASGSLPVATSSQSLVAQCISIWRWLTLMYVCTHRPRCGPVSARDALDKGEDRRHCSARRNALHTARKGPKALDHRAHWPADPAMCSSIAQACGTHHDPGTPLFSSESVLTRCVRQPRHPLCASLPSDQVSPCDTWLTRCNVAPPLAGLASPYATDRSCSSARRYARWHTHCTLARSTCCTPPAQPCVLADRAAGGSCPGRRPQSTRGGATHASQEARPRASRTLSPRTTRCARRRPCAQGLCRAWERRAWHA
jgi:hypothetical protein